MPRISELTYRSLNLLWLKKTIFDAGGNFRSATELKDFQLSHTHPLIAKVCQPPLEGKYGEIGSHCGRSMICAAVTNPKLQIFCFDKPNSGWGGEHGTDTELTANAEKFAKDRIKLFFGGSTTAKIKNSIAENGPYDVFLVDGDHRAEPAMADLKFVYPHVKEGGILIFDDLVHHKYLEDVWDNFVNEVKPFEHSKIMEITDQEAIFNYVRRGIGILIK